MDTMFRRTYAKICNYPGCPTLASFIDAQRVAACATHKTDKMISLYRKCFVKTCEKVSGFKDKNGKKACGIHKTNDMVSLYSKMCDQKGCMTQPSCNYEGEVIPAYCSKHKKPGMRSTARKCMYTDESFNCKKLPGYGYFGQRAEYCSKHKLKGMICLKRSKNTIITELNKKNDTLSDTVSEIVESSTMEMISDDPNVDEWVYAMLG
jgi:hypothetical protein